MATVLSGIAVLLSLLSVWVSISKRRNRDHDEITSLNHDIRKQLDDTHKQLNDIQRQISIITKRAENQSASISELSQAASTSGEIPALKEQIHSICRHLHENWQTVSALSLEIESIKKGQIASRIGVITAQDTVHQPSHSTNQPSALGKSSSILSSQGALAGSEVGHFVQTHDQSSSIQSELRPQVEPFEQIAHCYQDAIVRGDRQALRKMQFRELNITMESEDTLLRGNCIQATKLEAVQGGGSYMVVYSEGRYWLFPTAQTLDSFRINQPQKGIFIYEREVLSQPVVKTPAEVEEIGEYWVVSAHGVISVPG